MALFIPYSRYLLIPISDNVFLIIWKTLFVDVNCAMSLYAIICISKHFHFKPNTTFNIIRNFNVSMLTKFELRNLTFEIEFWTLVVFWQAELLNQVLCTKFTCICRRRRSQEFWHLISTVKFNLISNKLFWQKVFVFIFEATQIAHFSLINWSYLNHGIQVGRTRRRYDFYLLSSLNFQQSDNYEGQCLYKDIVERNGCPRPANRFSRQRNSVFVY